MVNGGERVFESTPLAGGDFVVDQSASRQMSTPIQVANTSPVGPVSPASTCLDSHNETLVCGTSRVASLASTAQLDTTVMSNVGSEDGAIVPGALCPASTTRVSNIMSAADSGIQLILGDNDELPIVVVTRMVGYNCLSPFG
ncbi:hypothetical protein V6N11_051400 [Hibiscus sabdariffa]|uniref:Uncharacterized protein n=1 Tax=Hibiscus sabdariffa TaxID=183260 RepID=A0ABR2U722_9ROSI